MSNFFPLFIDLSGKKCLVAGGGRVAERKIKELLKHGADVVVVSPDLTPSLDALLCKKKFSYKPSCFDEKYVDGIFLLIDATGSSDVSKKVSSIAGDRGILFNVVNDPEKSDFYNPAIFSRGDLKIAVSTSGKSPALAARIKKELSLKYGPEYAVFLRFFGRFRERILKRFKSRKIRKKVFQSIVESDIIDLMSRGDLAEAELYCEKIVDTVVESRGSSIP